MKPISELLQGGWTANGSGSNTQLASVMWTEGFNFYAPTSMQTETCAVRVALLQQNEDLSSKEVNLAELFRRATW